MKNLLKKKEYFLIGIVVVLFALVSYFSLTSIYQLSGTARVVNYAGIVRGATQRLVKKEIHGNPDDALVLRLDSIINDLTNGGGTNELIALPDKDFQNNMFQVRSMWGALKQQINLVRNGENDQQLFDLSEEYFILVDKTVSSAEVFSEAQVKQSTQILIVVDIVFIFIILVSAFTFIKSAAVKKRADALGKLAYIDILTQMPNRASCEREIDGISKNPPDTSTTTFMFDMNNLKRANDLLGHQGGDRVIADFARILKTESTGFGFVGRYGGDEFVAIFRECDADKAEKYISKINEKIVAYNILHIHEVEKISFAAGYVVALPSKTPIMEMINEADKKMYIRKRQMKENKEA